MREITFEEYLEDFLDSRFSMLSSKERDVAYKSYQLALEKMKRLNSLREMREQEIGKAEQAEIIFMRARCERLLSSQIISLTRIAENDKNAAAISAAHEAIKFGQQILAEKSTTKDKFILFFELNSTASREANKIS
jgi:hypothetical protein